MNNSGITAVLVLYRRSPTESEGLLSLCAAVEDVGVSESFDLLVYDNSPQSQSLGTLTSRAHYRWNPKNPGLAAAYNEGLKLAEASGAGWVMLLDQDTSVTESYLREALHLTEDLPRVAPRVAAIVPKLVHARGLHSPGQLPRWKDERIPTGHSGIFEAPVTAFNSGALIRVDALAAMGGFSLEFPLEFLDFYTFHRLQEAGYKVWVMTSELEHSLAMTTPDTKLLPRYRTMLAMEQKFYAMTGNRASHVWYRLRKARSAIGHLMRRRPVQFALLEVAAAIGVSFKLYCQKTGEQTGDQL